MAGSSIGSSSAWGIISILPYARYQHQTLTPSSNPILLADSKSSLTSVVMGRWSSWWGFERSLEGGKKFVRRGGCGRRQTRYPLAGSSRLYPPTTVLIDLNEEHPKTEHIGERCLQVGMLMAFKVAFPEVVPEVEARRKLSPRWAIERLYL